ncbi:hypothetical protein LguiB_030204 [Lonicera macranthoides]
MEEAVLTKQQHSRKDLYIYNTMSGEKEVFKTITPGEVKMYFCGITPYDYSHVGHGRSIVSFDVLYRYLKYLGYNVIYVRNFTDVDDKIINKANELNEDILTVSRRFSDLFIDEMTDLQCLPPTREPRIIHNGCAYAVDGNVYFSVAKCENYGCLSRQITEETIAGKRVKVDPNKQVPSDFALWKAAKPGEPYWDSPWGRGRPGWHIECSAMSSEYLSFKFDIHGGGMDLKFPHHENEIAQSWAACPESKVGYWVHVGSALKDGKKMSKSDGNYITIAETLEDCEVAVSHYRQGIPEEQNDSPKVKAGATGQVTAESQQCIKSLWNDFETKMSDDLQTTIILTGVILEPLKFINKSLKNLKVIKELKEKALERADLKEEHVLEMIRERGQARKGKDFTRADEIRRNLEAKGITLEDAIGQDTTYWRPCVPLRS